MPIPTIKKEARRLIDQLPEDVTWDDLQEQIAVRQAIEVGLRDCEERRVMDVATVRAKFGLDP